ncbi:EAL domain-containing protein [Marinobacteraceae bacterium S3BR75-40.1]
MPGYAIAERHHAAPEPGVSPSFGSFQLCSAFQPIVCLTHQKVVGYEALARARDAGRTVSPARLFNEAERLSQAATLDQQLNELHVATFARHNPAVWLFLNINRYSIQNETFDPESFAQNLRGLGLMPQQLVLEVVEDPVANDAHLAEFIERAKALDFRIAIDDFGAGDSNFERVWRLAPHIVKIDRNMLVNGTRHRRARQLLLSLVNLLRESGSLVLIEGVETEEEADLAFLTNADMFQGFYFAKPDPGLAEAPTIQQQLQHFTLQHHQTGWLRSEAHQDFLKLLRFEVLAACHELARAEPMADACQGLLQLPAVKRCFLLDFRGVQQGEIISRHAGVRREPFFNPLYQSSGACWSHRDYYRNAVDHPHQIHMSRPYVALPDAERTVTLSAVCYTRSGNHVLCVDLHPDDIFDGQLGFPATL